MRKLRAQQWLPQAISRKARKQNFSPSEIDALTKNVEEKLSVIHSKLTNRFTNQKKDDIWKQIEDAVNTVGVAMRTTAEVCEKWKSLHSQARREFTELAKEQKKTDGGPAPKTPSTSTAKFIDLLKDAPRLLLPASKISSRKVRGFPFSNHLNLKLKITYYF